MTQNPLHLILSCQKPKIKQFIFLTAAQPRSSEVRAAGSGSLSARAHTRSQVHQSAHSDVWSRFRNGGDNEAHWK